MKAPIKLGALGMCLGGKTALKAPLRNVLLPQLSDSESCPHIQGHPVYIFHTTAHAHHSEKWNEERRNYKNFCRRKKWYTLLAQLSHTRCYKRICTYKLHFMSVGTRHRLISLILPKCLGFQRGHTTYGRCVQ